MTHIRHATESDASRIAEIIVTNYRVNFYPFFITKGHIDRWVYSTPGAPKYIVTDFSE